MNIRFVYIMCRKGKLGYMGPSERNYFGVVFFWVI